MSGSIANYIAALTLAFYYLVTQNLQTKNKINSFQSLISIHIGMGIIAIPFIIIFEIWNLVSFDMIIKLLIINTPYLLAQLLVLYSIKISDSTVVSPLLILKVPSLAIIGIIFFNESLYFNQWISILILLLISIAISHNAGKIDFRTTIIIVLACIFYSIYDIEITKFTNSYSFDSIFEKISFTLSINYVFCAIILLLFAPKFKVEMNLIYKMKWSSAIWLLAMFFLISGFSSTGVIESNVAQSTRGVLAVIITILYIKAFKKEKESLKKWVKRFLLSASMIPCIILFYI